MNHLQRDHQSKSPGTFFSTFDKVVVVQAEAGETMELAWRRHTGEHPEDKLSRIKIFHFERREISKGRDISHGS